MRPKAKARSKIENEFSGRSQGSQAKLRLNTGHFSPGISKVKLGVSNTQGYDFPIPEGS